ncbi:MAG: hypothetical protein MUF38_06145 [Anaerolineae bacterium]|nr:hypothetical protein [Anaerolineae bacterium]
MDFLGLFALVISLASVWYLARQVHDARKQAFGQFLLELDNHFVRYQDIHRGLIEFEQDYDHNANIALVWQYIGLFERCKILIDKGIIDVQTFIDFYGYRLSRLLEHDGIRENIELNADDHFHFNKLCEMVDEASKSLKKRPSQFDQGE